MKRILAAVALAACGLLSGCSGSSSGTSGSSIPAPSEDIGDQANISVPASIANIPLVDSNGKATSLGAFRGRAVMVADYMTLCEDICPMITANTMAMGRALTAAGDASKTALLEITIDPRRDSLHRIRAYRKLYGSIPSNVYFLRASPANSAALWKFFHVYVKKVKEGKPADKDWLTGKPLTYDIDHSDDLIFFDPRGNERFVVDGGPDVQGHTDAVPGRLKKVLSHEGKQDLYHPDTVEDWTVSQGNDVFSWLLDKRVPNST